MTDRHKRIRPTRKPGTRPDIQLVELALTYLAEVKPRGKFAGIGDRESRKQTNGARRELQARLLPLIADLENLVAREVPDARITSPCGACPGPDIIRSPLENLMACYDLCGPCLEETRRSFQLTRNALLGKRTGDFLPPEVIAARISAAQAKEARSENERAARPRVSVRLTSSPDGAAVWEVARLEAQMPRKSNSGAPAEAAPRRTRGSKRIPTLEPGWITMSQAEEETGRPRSSLQRYEPALEKLGALRRDKDQNVVVVLRVALLELLARKHRR